MLKSMIIAAAALLCIQTATAQDNKKQQLRKITGQDSGSWHQPRAPKTDTPPVRSTLPNRQNTITPLPSTPNTVNMQPRGVNPDSTRRPGTPVAPTPGMPTPGAPIQGNPTDPMKK